MFLLLISLAILCAALFLYLWLIRPDASRKKECLSFTRWNFAHRGLWDLSIKVPENSLPAFRRAAEQGFAIELDVHLTKDQELVVFHDDTLTRMCRQDHTIEHMTYQQLSHCRLLDTDCQIPKLTDVLNLVAGRVPLLIELKLPSRDMRLCHRLLQELRSYKGNYLIESFNPFGLRWFRRHCPTILRGQLAARYETSRGLDRIIKFFSTTLLVNCLSRPDFIAYNYQHTTGLGFRLNHRFYKIPVFAWTVRSHLAYNTCKRQFDTVIFENFLPNNKRIC